MNPTHAGVAAILMWSLLALMTAASGVIPPFQLLAMTFAIGGTCGFITWPFRKTKPSLRGIPLSVWLTGSIGLFGYHFFYYTALRNAPVAEASLIAYLWPMLIVLGSALLPGERLRWFHFVGASCGFAGAALLLTRSGLVFSGSLIGYGSALACAFIWSSYSILSRHQKAAPTDAIAAYSLITAMLSLICHRMFETTAWPQDLGQWAAVGGLGLLPVGLAFYAWDHGVKHGNIQLLGSLAYLSPLVSTLLLVLFAMAVPDWKLFAATLLITVGALIASGKIMSGRMEG
ncbi:MAG: EamA family transporter [Rhizobiaceae bacterium]